MSEAGDYTPGWAGHDFDSARRDYRNHVNTSYNSAVSKGITVNDLVVEFLETKSKNVVRLLTDQTGSMGEWFVTIKSKFPYLEHEARTEYFDKDVVFSVGAFGDAPNNEKYPLQIRPYASGKEIATRTDELVHEKNGGGTTYESSELGLLYYARRTKEPNVINSLTIVITDESPYATIDPEMALKVARVELEKRITTNEVVRELQTKTELYVVLKPYSSEVLTDGHLTGTTKRVYTDWAKLVGEDHIALLGDPNRVVDVIFGIMAQVAGRIKYFEKELKDRQRPDQVKTVMTSLKTIHALPKGNVSKRRLLGDGKSVMHRTTKNKKEEKDDD